MAEVRGIAQEGATSVHPAKMNSRKQEKEGNFLIIDLILVSSDQLDKSWIQQHLNMGGHNLNSNPI